MKQRLFSFLVLALSAMLSVVAADKVYISDFSIKAGESKMIALNFDTDRTDVQIIEGTVSLPDGLTIMNQGSESSKIWMTADGTRAGGAIANMNPTSGALTIYSLASAISGTTGAVGYIKVAATTDLPEESTITVSNFTLTLTDNTKITAETANATVTREAGEGGGGGGGGEESSELAFSFSPTPLTMTAGATKTVDVMMTNGMTLTGFEGKVKASTGLTITGIERNSRVSGMWNYNETNGKIMSLGSISGNEGTVFTISLQADATFSGAATVTITGLAATNTATKTFTADDITLPVTVQSQKNVALSFGSQQEALRPGESTTVDVTLDSEVSLTGFTGKLTLPTGITATVEKGALLNSNPNYNKSTGVIFYLGTSEMTATEGVLFKLTLTADASFTEDGEVTFTDIATTTVSAQSIVPADISLPVVLKTSAGVTPPTARTGLVYNGAAQALITAGSSEGGTVQYSLDNTTYSTDIPAGTDAGTYTVWYKVVADATHIDVDPASINVTIDKASLSVAELQTSSLTYNGSEQTATVSSVKAGTLTVDANDYTVSGDKATNVGNYTVTVKAKADAKNFKGETTAQWSIVAAEAASFTITVDPETLTYDGTAKTPAVTVTSKDGSPVLTLDEDYTLAYSNNINAGTAKVTVTGKGNYSGTQEKTFTIEKATLSEMTLDPATLTYNRTEQTVSVTSVKAGENLTVTAENYSVSGNKATNAGEYTVTVKATGANFQGTLTKKFTINPASADNLEVTLGTSTYSYDGTAKTPAVTVKDGDAPLVFDQDYTIAYSNNVNAGQATATVTCKGNYTGTKTANFTIAKAQLTGLTLDAESLTYTGSELTVNVSSVKAGELTVPAECYQVSGNTQTNVDTYTVTATAKAGGNYDGSATAKFSITKAEADVTAPTAKENLVYNATAQALIEAGSTKSGEMQYSLDGTTYVATIPAGTDAGTYTVYYKVKGDGNHNDSEPASVTVEIAKAELTSVTIDATSSLTYTGTEQTVNVTGVTAGTLEVSASDYTVEGNKGTNVDNYTVTVTAKAEAKNFKGSATTDWSIVAADAKTFDVTLDPTEFTYDGTAKTPVVTVTSKDGSPVLTLDQDYTVAYSNNVDAGTATVTVTGKGNYSGTKTANFTIKKANASVTTAPTAKENLVYNGQAQTLIEAGTAEGGELQYSLDGTTYATTIPAVTTAGTNTVWYKVVGDKNHNDTEAASVTVTIAKAELTDATLNKTSMVYNKTEQTVTVNSVKAGELSVATENYTVEGNSGTNAGTYTVSVTANANSNFQGEVTKKWTITAADASTAFTITVDPETLTYDGSEKKPSVTVMDGSAVLVLDQDYSVEYKDNVNVGQATVTVIGKGNYTGEKTANFTIEKVAATVATAPEAETELYYNGQAQTLVSEGKVEGGTMQYSLDGTTWQTTLPTGVNAGAYTVYYKAVGDANHNDSEAAFVSVAIYKAALTEVTLAQTELTYNGSEQTVGVSSVKAGTLDVTDKDYVVSGNKGTDVNTYTVTVTANEDGNFTGSVTAQWTIVAAAAETKFTIELEYTTVEYDGTEKKPAVTVKDGSAVLTENTDYTVAYSNNVNAGTATVTVTGKGNYSGTKTATFTITRKSFDIEAEDSDNGNTVAGVTVNVTMNDEDHTVSIDNLNVPTGAEGEELTIHIPATVGGYEVTEIASGAISNNVTDIYMPDTEAPLTIAEGALPETATIHTSLGLLDDYALMTTLQDNYEAAKVMTTVKPKNKFWTLGTGCDVILPAELTAYTVSVRNETEVNMNVISEADLTIGDARVLKGNNGILMLGEAGESYDLVAYSGRIASGTAIATTDNKDYGTDNLLEPVVENMHYEADDFYFVMNSNEFHAIKAEAASAKVPAGKAVLHLTSGQAGARASVLSIVEGETTSVNEELRMKNEESATAIYDLQGRRVQKTAKGLYIVNGKKVVMK